MSQPSLLPTISAPQLPTRNGRFLNLGKCMGWGAFWGAFTSFNLWGMIAGVAVGVVVSAYTSSLEKRR